MIFAPFLFGVEIDKRVCTNLVKYFENSPYKVPGTCRDAATNQVYIDPDYKESTDLNVPCYTEDKAMLRYFEELTNVVNAYKEEFIWCDKNHGRWTILENVNIQKYDPGQGFKAWHFERSAAAPNRHLVFMTYLNDVTDGGETEWFYQKVSVQPKKGLTVIWPADWTFTHRGVPSLTQTKYIATGWYSFA
jgi:hypothetical protein